MIIYCTLNKITGRIYIGKDTKNDPNYLGSGKILKHAIKKYGAHNFSKHILEHCSSKKELEKKERIWITGLNTTNRVIGYNITKGGTGEDTFTNNPNKEKIRKQKSKKLKGRPSPKKGTTIKTETKQKISKNNGRYWKGKHLSIQTKNKLREKNKKQDMSYQHVKYTLLSPDNKIIITTKGLSHFLKEHNIPKTCFYRLVKNPAKKYKGWKILCNTTVS